MHRLQPAAEWERQTQAVMHLHCVRGNETEVESVPAVEPVAGGDIDLNSNPGASRVSMMKQKVVRSTAAEQQSSDVVSTEHGSSSAAQEHHRDTNGAPEPLN
ncbi:hypothetical protein F2Q68_00029071 [Brassica cretica]|uniref:Uncharacterized protein n=1 Tax=Brassica cretica TaxID=69181 RepID=A0A8S9GDF0_BRACR|nr:hypothetical protein F2Q68_00029071 [Brassica cretica]